jgi:hypothetical protein
MEDWETKCVASINKAFTLTYLLNNFYVFIFSRVFLCWFIIWQYNLFCSVWSPLYGVINKLKNYKYAQYRVQIHHKFVNFFNHYLHLNSARRCTWRKLMQFFVPSDLLNPLPYSSSFKWVCMLLQIYTLKKGALTLIFLFNMK